MAKVSNQDIYNQDDNLSMEDYLLGTNNGTNNKKTQTYSLGSIFSLFYNFLGFNTFLFTTYTTTYPIGTPGCFFVFDENDDLTNNFTESRKITFSATDTYNLNVAEYFGIVVNSGKFLFKLINLEDKNNFVFLKPSNFVLGGTGTTFNVDVLAESGLSNGSFVNYKRYLLVLEFAAGTFDPADYDLTDFTNTSGNPFVTAQDLTDALALLPTPIRNHSGLNLDDGTNPHGTTKSDVGLGNVDNTSDIDKPISTATQNALDSKLDKSTTPSSVYTTDAGGLQVMKPLSDFKNVLEYANLAALPATGETGKIYIALDTNNTYRWSGSAYVQLSAGIDFPIDDKIYGVRDNEPVEIVIEKEILTLNLGRFNANPSSVGVYTSHSSFSSYYNPISSTGVSNHNLLIPNYNSVVFKVPFDCSLIDIVLMMSAVKDASFSIWKTAPNSIDLSPVELFHVDDNSNVAFKQFIINSDKILKDSFIHLFYTKRTTTSLFPTGGFLNFKRL